VKDGAGAVVGDVKSAASAAGKTYAIALVKAAVATHGAEVFIGDVKATVTGAPKEKPAK
jgi:hypothetical protein